MKFLEKDLEQIIYESDRDLLSSKGLDIVGKLFRQLRIGNYGIADIVEVSRVNEPNYNGTRIVPYLYITVYELKKDKIGISAFLQAIGYAKGISRYLEGRKFNHCVKFNITLIGSSIDICSSYVYLSELLDSDNFFINNYTYSYDINGISFKNEYGFKLTHEGF